MDPNPSNFFHAAKTYFRFKVCENLIVFACVFVSSCIPLSVVAGEVFLRQPSVGQDRHEKCTLTYSEKKLFGGEVTVTLSDPPDMTEKAWLETQRLRKVTFKCGKEAALFGRLEVGPIHPNQNYEKSYPEFWGSNFEVSRMTVQQDDWVMISVRDRLKFFECRGPIVDSGPFYATEGARRLRCQKSRKDYESIYRYVEEKDECIFFSGGRVGEHNFILQNWVSSNCPSPNAEEAQVRFLKFHRDGVQLIQWLRQDNSLP